MEVEVNNQVAKWQGLETRREHLEWDCEFGRIATWPCPHAAMTYPYMSGPR